MSESIRTIRSLGKYPGITKFYHEGLQQPLQQLKADEVLVVGDPDLSHDKALCWPPLPNALDEATYTAYWAGGHQPLVGKAASFTNVMGRLKKNSTVLRFIYFATHAVADPVNPFDGGYLALGGRHLHGADFRNLSLSAHPVVVMSACETGLGKTFPGGIFGLTSAWYYSGAHQVVMSLWDVSDVGTDHLMHRLIDRMKESNEGTEYSLAGAIRDLKQSEPDPAVWSAFTVYGDSTFFPEGEPRAIGKSFPESR